MNRDQQRETPLYDALKKYTARDTVHFDVPGHKKRNSPDLAEAFGQQVLRMDANSTKELDMLGNSSGVILQAEQLMAQAYGADHAFLLVNGSTSGVLYMVMTACAPKDKIIMPRNVHKSAINAVILSGAVPVFVQPEIDPEYGIANSLSFEDIKETLKEHPDARAVFIINPTYFGATPDLKSIIRYCHRHKVAVLVDEAHGAHLPFHPDLPDSAMAAGADMSTVSMHKTGGSLTQSSVLLLNEGLIQKHQVNTVVNLMQTTSASYLLMASLDIARRHLALRGRKFYDEMLAVLDEAKREIGRMPGLSVLTREYINGSGLYDYDETKLVIRANDLGFTGFEIYDLLREEYGIQVELAETYVILAVVGTGDDRSTVNKLVEALRDISRRHFGTRKPFCVSLADFFEKPRTVIAPRDAWYSPKKVMPILESVGEVCGESIMIYPPGIPLIIPGERVTEKVVEHYQFYLDQHCVVAHDEDHPMQIKVLGE